jgi:hypothetical protein
MRKMTGKWWKVEKSEPHKVIFKAVLKKIDDDEENITEAEYKAAKSRAKVRFESMIDDALSGEGMSRKDFESDLSLKDKPERLFRVFASAKRKMLDANDAKYGVPDADGSVYGNKAMYVVPDLDEDSPVYSSALKTRASNIEVAGERFIDCQSIFAKYLINSDSGKPKNITIDNQYSRTGRASMFNKDEDLIKEEIMGKVHSNLGFASKNLIKSIAKHLSGGGGIMRLFIGDIKDTEGRSIFHHEFGHFVEHINKRLYGASIRFLQERSGGDFTAYKLGDLALGNYENTEFCIPDKFSEPYVGKIYEKSSEVSSMCIQNFSQGSTMAALYNDDRDMFYHAAGIILGEY